MITTKTFDWLQEPLEGFLYSSKYVVASMVSASSSSNVQIYLKLSDMVKWREIDYANPSYTNIIFSLSKKSLGMAYGIPQQQILDLESGLKQTSFEDFFFFFCWFFAKTQNSIDWPTIKTAIDFAIEETITRIF